DVNGQSKGFTYDAKGRITAIINDADGSSTTISYNAAGQPASVTDEDGVTTSSDYDSNGRLTRITDIEGNYIAYVYDGQGNRIKMSKHNPLDNRTYLKRWSYEHPVLPGKLWKEINADNTFTEYGYDAEGNTASVTDPNSNTTTYEYDPFNRLTTITQPVDVITTYTYDPYGNLASVTDANGNLTSYQYDDMARLLSTTSPDTGTTTYTYDSAGNLLTKTDAKGITTHYTYDPLNRLTHIHFPDPTEDITYSYDAGTYGKGRKTGMMDLSGETTFTYDARGRLAQKTSTIPDYSYSISATYSPGSRVMKVTYPSTRTLDYTRDSMGRMKGLSTTYDTGTVTLVSNMTYNPFGNPKGLNTGSGGEVNNQSGESGSIERANPGEQMERVYTYDGNRNLIDVYSPNIPWYNQAFTYDTLNRHTSAEGRYGAINYTYDDVGNRLTKTVNDDTDDYTYLTGTNKLDHITGANPTSFTYDANGNTTAIGSKTLISNHNNRLIRVEEGESTVAEYTYNGLGQRVTKTVDGTTTVFHYDLNGKLLAEGLADGTITAEYLYMGKIRIAMVDVSSGSMYYYLNDRLGTPQLMTDDTGTVVWEASYKPFGEATINPKSSVVNNFRFPGQYYDEETGLHYNYFRYYDPRTGRYLTPDPSHSVQPRGSIIPYLTPYLLNTPQELSLFAYVTGNPLKYVDPDGLNIGIPPFDDPIPGRAYIECLRRVEAKYIPQLLKVLDNYKKCLNTCDRIRELECEVGSTMKTITVGGCKLACFFEYTVDYYKLGFKIGVRSLACWALYQQEEKEAIYRNTEP
ncbi:MAG: RHS repeat protein, partial [Desulfobacteraceae bacterium]|nr:RHS repeat protein [Desulfobacteraceae bacterium]